MFEIASVPMDALAIDTAQLAALVGPPGGLPAPVPEFVGNLLSEIGSLVGDATGGIGETVSGLTPGEG